MSATFKRNTTLSGIFKDVCIRDGHFIDEESGEIINVAGILSEVYGENTFDIKTTHKSDNEVTPDREE